MKLQEAITDASIQLEVKRRLGKSYQADALKLLIEAGKREQWNRLKTASQYTVLLLGETKE